MICKNCNAEIEDSSVFCINCGTPVEIEPVRPQPQRAPQPAYQQPVYQQPAQPVYQQQPAYQQPAQPVYQQQPAYQQPAQPVYQQQPAYQQPAQPVYQQPVYEDEAEDPDNMAPITRVGQYIGWFFLLCIPVVGFPILSIVFACIRNKNNKNRANFFAATWAFLGILVAIAAFFGLIGGLIMLLLNM